MIDFLTGWECWTILVLVVIALSFMYIDLGRGAIYKKTIHIKRYYDGVFDIWSDLTKNEIRNVEGVFSVSSNIDGALRVVINKQYIVSNVLRRIRQLASEKESGEQ